MADAVYAEVNVSGFVKALEDYAAYSSRETVDVINAACLDVAIKAAQATPKATAAGIGTELDRLVWVSARDTLKSGRQRVRPRLLPLRIAIVLARDKKKGGTMSLSQLRQAAVKMAAARKKSAGYIAYAGWANAVLAFGGRGFGSKGSVNPKSRAAAGGGTLATAQRLEAVLTNTAVGAVAVALGPLQSVLNAKAGALRRRLAEKLNKLREV